MSKATGGAQDADSSGLTDEQLAAARHLLDDDDDRVAQIAAVVLQSAEDSEVMSS